MDKPIPGGSTLDYNEVVDDILAAWVEYAIRQLQAKLKARKMVFDGKLAATLGFEVRGAIEGRAMAKLNLQQYGRYRDMKRLTYTRPANYDAMLRFVEKMGLQSFKYVPGYNPAQRKVRRIPTTSVAMNRIAWGVAWSRYRKYSHRRKQWLNKFFYGPVVGQLVDMLVEKTGTSAVQIIEADLEAAFNQ